MEYWKGKMDWQLEPSWKCETCGKSVGLTWGLVNGECRCNLCHTPYYMKDKDGNITSVPKNDIIAKYRDEVKALYEKYQRPIEEIPEEEYKKLRDSMNKGEKKWAKR